MLTIYVVKVPQSPQKHIKLRETLSKIYALNGIQQNKQDTMECKAKKMKKEGYFVNITYADQYAFVLLTKERFGIDAETIKPQPKENKDTLSSLLSVQVKSDMDFYQKWTSMEAEVKYYGDKGIFDALGGKLPKNAQLKTKFCQFQNNLIAITSADININNQKIYFVQI